MRKHDAPPPEHDESVKGDKRPHVRAAEPGVLTAIEVVLPDGRYLLAFSRIPPDPSDA
jgi:hypothetical protein